MSKNMTTTLETAAQGAELQVRMLLEIYAPDNTFRFVANDNADVVFGGNTYTAALIERGDIKTTLEGDKEAISLKLSNRWQEWAAYLANNGNVLNGCRVVIMDVFLDHLDQGAVWRFEGVLNKIRMTISDFSANAERDTIDFQQSAPGMDYGPTCQYIYKDARCQSASLEASCDLTLTACETRGNLLRFGGHPSIPREMVIKG